jgi:hypothetical protein
MEFNGTTDNGNPSQKFWYATGRALNEPVEVGWGAIGSLPQTQLIDWTELQNRVNDKLAKGYDYAPTDFIRMTAASIATIGGQAPVPVPSPSPVTKAPPVPVAASVAPSTPTGPVVYSKAPTAALLALGEPWSLIRALKVQRKGTVVTHYAALDATGAHLLDFTSKAALEFATQHDVEVEF